jgi:glutamyl-tRNA synthetase
LVTVRVRFAPSPTGFLHVGGLRTALYNYLYARHHGGAFILRVEDTDRSRYVEGAVENLIATLRWAGLEYDEGPDRPGTAGPYIQSERIHLYREHADRLLTEGKAYYAFDTPEELEAMRKEQERMRIPPKYDRRALRLTADEVRSKLEAGEPAVVRMKVPESETIAFEDVIRGRVEFSSDRIDDQVLLKSDGYPTYHLANVVDDHTMGITHIIRGEEWLSSTPKHVLLYRYFGWEPPAFAHLPLLLNPDRSKLSKRQGDVAVEDYRAKGFFPEALVNFVALLGWNPGDERELFSLEELVREFTLERVGKSGAVFNLDKLNWMNTQYVRRTSGGDLLAMLRPALEKAGFAVQSDDYIRRAIDLMRDRVDRVEDFVTFSPYLFADPAAYDDGARKKYWTGDTPALLRSVMAALETAESFDHAAIEEAVRRTAESAGVSASKLIHPLRLAVSGMAIGPGLFELMSLLGRETCLRRIDTALRRFSV